MTVLLDGIPPGTRVSCPTAPWRRRARTDHAGPVPVVLHVVSFISPDGQIPVALCRRDLILEHPPAPDQCGGRCTRCLYLVTFHGLWPL